MASGKSLMEGDCGRPNALVRFTNQLASAPSLLSSRPSTSATLHQDMTREYLAEASARAVAPSTFSMQSLLQQVNGSTAPLRSADQWTREYATTRDDQWVREYGAARPTARLPDADVLYTEGWQLATDAEPRLSRDYSDTWSAQYLNKVDQDFTADQRQANGWTDEYLSSTASANWSDMEFEWDQMAKNSAEREWLSEYQDSISTLYKEYDMSEDNPFLNVDNPLAEGKRLWAEGDLGKAILHFEAAIARHADNAEAWQCIGMAQAENEQEPAAIAALRRALQLRPADEAALLSLAVAYTNESLYNDALDTLGRWLGANPQYASVAPVGVDGADRQPRVSSFLDRSDAASPRRKCSDRPFSDYFSELENSFLRASALQPANVDAQLQNALAVLYNLSANYDRAVDSLRAALQSHPEDARLWNRLGATLANGGRSEEAVYAYGKALEHYPGYVRARYNLGISCSNLKSHREAIEHFVSALSLQRRGIGPTSELHMSDAIWRTLRPAVLGLGGASVNSLLAALDRRDLDAFSSELRRSQTAPSLAE